MSSARIGTRLRQYRIGSRFRGDSLAPLNFGLKFSRFSDDDSGTRHVTDWSRRKPDLVLRPLGLDPILVFTQNFESLCLAHWNLDIIFEDGGILARPRCLSRSTTIRTVTRVDMLFSTTRFLLTPRRPALSKKHPAVATHEESPRLPVARRWRREYGAIPASDTVQSSAFCRELQSTSCVGCSDQSTVWTPPCPTCALYSAMTR